MFAYFTPVCYTDLLANTNIPSLALVSCPVYVENSLGMRSTSLALLPDLRTTDYGTLLGSSDLDN